MHRNSHKFDSRNHRKSTAPVSNKFSYLSSMSFEFLLLLTGAMTSLMFIYSFVRKTKNIENRWKCYDLLFMIFLGSSYTFVHRWVDYWNFVWSTLVENMNELATKVGLISKVLLGLKTSCQEVLWFFLHFWK